MSNFVWIFTLNSAYCTLWEDTMCRGRQPLKSTQMTDVNVHLKKSQLNVYTLLLQCQSLTTASCKSAELTSSHMKFQCSLATPSVELQNNPPCSGDVDRSIRQSELHTPELQNHPDSEYKRKAVSFFITWRSQKYSVTIWEVGLYYLSIRYVQVFNSLIRFINVLKP